MGKEEGGEAKKDDGSTGIVVLKVDLHCEGCAEKLKKSVREFEGVERVKADVGGEMLTVMGKVVDPGGLRDRVAAKIQKKVELVSPANPRKKAACEKGHSKKPADEKGAAQKPVCEKCKDSAVVLKMPLHCNCCINQIERKIKQIKGVTHVTVDRRNDRVTVMGRRMDAKALRPGDLSNMLKRRVEVVEPKKDEAGEKKKDKKCSDQKETSDGGGKGDCGKVAPAPPPSDNKETSDGGGKGDCGKVAPAPPPSDNKETCDGGGKGDCGNVAPAPPPNPPAPVPPNPMGYYAGCPHRPPPAPVPPNPMGYYAGCPHRPPPAPVPPNPMGYYAGCPHRPPAPNPMGYHAGCPYHRIEMAPAALLFSDENPNACSVM